MTAAYVVMVDENSHYLDRDERWTRGSYATAEEALAECRRIIDADLAELHQPGMAAEQLITGYRASGRDPFIIPRDGAEFVAFSGWTYAEQRAAAICGEAPAATDEPAAAIESDNEPSFWTVAAKYPFLMRLSPETGAEFFNRRTQRWHRWPGQVPPCVRIVSRATAWEWLRHEALGLDFGTLDRDHRDWPEAAGG